MQLIQPSFAGGEISPDIYSRVDVAKYNVALRTAENFFIRMQGGASNRAGLEFTAPLKYSNTRANLIKFQFNTLQTYTLVFGDFYMWVVKDGGLVLNTAKSITAITIANPGVFTSAAHGYVNGQWVYISGIKGISGLNGRFYQIAGATANTFTLTDGFGGVINTAVLGGAYVSSGIVADVFELATPYSEADVDLLDYAQSADTMTIVHPNYSPRDLTRTAHNAWQLTVITLAPQLAAPAGVGVVATVGAGAVTYRYVVTDIANETFEESLPSSIVSCANNLVTAGNYNTVSWGAVAGAQKYYVYRETNGSGVFGYIGSGIGTSFIDQNIDADETDTPPTARNPFSGAGNYPASVGYHEQRRVFGYTNTKPQTVYSTQAGNYKNMNVSSPTRDDDAWTFNVASEEVNAIRYLVSLNNLLVFTSGAEFTFKPGSTGDTITPSSISVKLESRYGSAQVKPIVIGKTVLFAESSQSTDAKDNAYSIRDLGYTFATDDYNGNDLTILAKHLFEFERMTQWAFAKRPFSIAWGIRTDGVCCGLTYLKEHEVFAWSRHITKGDFLKVACTPEDGEDRPYFIVERVINGITRRYIENMHTRKYRNVEDAFFVDCGLTLDNWNADAVTTMMLSGGVTWYAEEAMTLTASAPTFANTDVGRRIFLRIKDRYGVIVDTVPVDITVYGSNVSVTVSPVRIIPTSLRNVATLNWGFGQTTIYGLDHLEGELVSILADGNVLVPQTVTGGKITVPDPVVKAHVGIGYNADLHTLAIAGDVSKGSLLGKPVSVAQINIYTQETRSLSVGPNADKLTEQKQRQFENWAEPTRLNTGIVKATTQASWSDGSFLIRQSNPLPVTILAVLPDASAGNS